MVMVHRLTIGSLRRPVSVRVRWPWVPIWWRCLLPVMVAASIMHTGISLNLAPMKASSVLNLVVQLLLLARR